MFLSVSSVMSASLERPGGALRCGALRALAGGRRLHRQLFEAWIADAASLGAGLPALSASPFEAVQHWLGGMLLDLEWWESVSS